MSVVTEIMSRRCTGWCNMVMVLHQEVGIWNQSENEMARTRASSSGSEAEVTGFMPPSILTVLVLVDMLCTWKEQQHRWKVQWRRQLHCRWLRQNWTQECPVLRIWCMLWGCLNHWNWKSTYPCFWKSKIRGTVILENNWSVGGSIRHIKTIQKYLKDMKEEEYLVLKCISGESNRTVIFLRIVMFQYSTGI